MLMLSLTHTAPLISHMRVKYEIKLLNVKLEQNLSRIEYTKNHNLEVS